MPEICSAPDIANIEIPIDVWTQPFWDATAERLLKFPSCADCGHFRWPPGPFCPHCQSQNTNWLPGGEGHIYSFTVVRERVEKEGTAPRIHVAALVEFPDADGVRLLAAIVDASLDQIKIGKALSVTWSQAANVTVPIFMIR